MTKKDFEILAEILAQVQLAHDLRLPPLNDGNKRAIDYYLAQSNPRYNPTKFWQAVESKCIENSDMLVKKP